MVSNKTTINPKPITPVTVIVFKRDGTNCRYAANEISFTPKSPLKSTRTRLRKTKNKRARTTLIFFRYDIIIIIQVLTIP
jgi:hypothetical protein